MLVSHIPVAASGRRGLRVFRSFVPGMAAAFLLCALVACAGRSASASTFRINITATNLTANTNYKLGFDLENALLDNPLQARVSNFSLLGGTLGSGSSSIGSNPATGNLNSTLSLATFDGSDFFDTSDWVQNFTSTTDSAVMAFTLNLSSSFPQSDSSVPDFFRFSFLNSAGTPFATTAADNVSLVYAAFDSTSPPVGTFRTVNFNDPNPTGPKVAAQIVPNAAPEPTTLALLLPFGAGGAILLRYRRKRTSSRA